MKPESKQVARLFDEKHAENARKLFRDVDSSSIGIQLLGPPEFGYHFSRDSHFMENMTPELKADLDMDNLPIGFWIPASKTCGLDGLPTSPLRMKKAKVISAQYDVAIAADLSEYQIVHEPIPIRLVLNEDPTSTWGTKIRSVRYWQSSLFPFKTPGVFRYTFEFDFAAEDILTHGKNWVKLSSLGCHLEYDHPFASTRVWVNRSKMIHAASADQ